MRQRQHRQRKRQNHGNCLRCNHSAVPVVMVSDITAQRREEQHRHLARKSKNAQQHGRMRQSVDQPLLGHVLHPRPDERCELSRDEELEVAVLHRAKARREIIAEAYRKAGASLRRRGPVDRFAVNTQKILPPLVRCGESNLVTMPRTKGDCQRRVALAQTPNWRVIGVWSFWANGSLREGLRVLSFSNDPAWRSGRLWNLQLRTCD